MSKGKDASGQKSYKREKKTKKLGARNYPLRERRQKISNLKRARESERRKKPTKKKKGGRTLARSTTNGQNGPVQGCISGERSPEKGEENGGYVYPGRRECVLVSNFRVPDL